MTSHKQIFRSSAITGGASVVNILIGIVKVKVLALLLGPSGIGLMGVYQNIVGIASTVAGCGIGSSGVRQLASTTEQSPTFAVVRRALWTANLFLGLIGMTVLWLLRESVARWVFGNTEHVSAVGWLGLGVLLTLVSASQTALLQGLRRIGDLARVSILGAFFSAIVGILPIYWLRERGVIWFVLTSPAISIVIAGYYAARLPRPKLMHSSWSALSTQWQALLKLGLPLMIGSLLTLATQLATRSIILRELGLNASGHFQAAWYISMTYIGFVLGAMSTDYYPRLTASIDDHSQTTKIVNEQAEMALLLAGPVLLAMITLAPWIIHLLYAASFSPAGDVLRWQVLGDILKVSSWPMSFILLAQSRGGIFIGTEMVWNMVYLGMIILGVKEKGLIIAGISFLSAYLFYYSVVAFAVSRSIGYLPAYRNWLLTLFLLVAGGGIMFFATQSPQTSYTFGLISTAITCYYSMSRLNNLMQLSEFISQKIQKIG